MKETLVKIGEGGRVVIPATLRKAMGVAIGDELIVRLVDGELRMLTPRQAVTRTVAGTAVRAERVSPR